MRRLNQSISEVSSIFKILQIGKNMLKSRDSMNTFNFKDIINFQGKKICVFGALVIDKRIKNMETQSRCSLLRITTKY